MSGAIHPLSNTPSWCGAQLQKAEGQLYIFTLSIMALSTETFQ